MRNESAISNWQFVIFFMFFRNSKIKCFNCQSNKIMNIFRIKFSGWDFSVLGWFNCFQKHETVKFYGTGRRRRKHIFESTLHIYNARSDFVSRKNVTGLNRQCQCYAFKVGSNPIGASFFFFLKISLSPTDPKRPRTGNSLVIMGIF
jgi:hypothetical protein